MGELMNRSRGFAEGVVVMICPVLLALALDKVDLKSEVYGHVAPIAMLGIAGVTLISGICPLLACCFSERFPSANVRPAPVTTSLAPLSSSCLLVLACWIAQLIVSKSIAIPIGAVFGACVVARTFCYYRARDANNPPTRSREFHTILDDSHEFLSGVTGILFLGLEGLALEGNNQISKGHGRQLALGLGAPMGTISFIVCALGVFLMFLEMIPPLKFVSVDQIVDFTLILDSTMAAGTFTVLVAVMIKLMGVRALVLFTPPVVIIGEFVYRVAVRRNVASGNQESKPASLELTRVTFTGFLAVSVTAISNDSPSKLTDWFLLFAAAAIVFGLSWRLLSQIQIRRVLVEAQLASSADVASSANLASFCAHFCIVIATILFAVMAGMARDAKEQNIAPAPDAGNDTRASHMISSAQIFTPAHVITGCTSVFLLFF